MYRQRNTKLGIYLAKLLENIRPTTAYQGTLVLFQYTKEYSSIS